MDLCGSQGEKGGHPEEEERGTFWRGTSIAMDTCLRATHRQARLRGGRALGKDEEEVAAALMAQRKARGHPHAPPAIATDGQGSYREAMVETWGQVPAYAGRGRPPTRKQAQPDWRYLQGIKPSSGNRLTGVTIQVISGDPEEVRELLGAHTAYVERTHLPSRHMNGRLVRKSLSFSKKREMLEAAGAWEDWVYNLTRPVKTLRIEVNDGQRRWQPRTPAMAAGLTDHIWTVKELLRAVVAPDVTNTK